MIRVPRIARMVGQIGHARGDAHARHDGYAQNDGAGLAQALGGDGILGRRRQIDGGDVARAVPLHGAGQALDHDMLFYGDGYAMQQAGLVSAGQRLIGLAGLIPGAGHIHGAESVQLRV